jgi:quercetin dioxygenase-like cupin family protein
MRRLLQLALLCIAILMLGFVASAIAQDGAFKQTATAKQVELQRVDVPESNYEVIFEMVEISPGTVARHTHPGPTLVYVLEGSFTLLVDGHPPRSFKVGDSLVEPAGVIHEGYGDEPTKIMAVFVVPRGQSVVSPAR